ncbi:hypothetical protein BDZ89DRAFT_1147749 [Hymenopellis radicata]|nr:hypothetical protein BDZ89DRAFT_1147749 [Hymenopellis radicata]
MYKRCSDGKNSSHRPSSSFKPSLHEVSFALSSTHIYIDILQDVYSHFETAASGESRPKAAKAISSSKKPKGKRASQGLKGTTKKAVAVSPDADHALPAAATSEVIPRQRPVRVPLRRTFATTVDEDEMSERATVGSEYMDPASIDLVDVGQLQTFDPSQLGTEDAEYSEDEEFTQSQATVPAENSVPSPPAVITSPRRSPRNHEGSLEPVVKSNKNKNKRKPSNDKLDGNDERASTPPRLDDGTSVSTADTSPVNTDCDSSSCSDKLKRKRSDEDVEDAPAAKVRRGDDGSPIPLPVIPEAAPPSGDVALTPDVTPLITDSVAPPPDINPAGHASYFMNGPPSPGRPRGLMRQASFYIPRGQPFSDAYFPEGIQ